jgi:hypothetical protein
MKRLFKYFCNLFRARDFNQIDNIRQEKFRLQKEETIKRCKGLVDRYDEEFERLKHLININFE